MMQGQSPTCCGTVAHIPAFWSPVSNLPPLSHRSHLITAIAVLALHATLGIPQCSVWVHHVNWLLNFSGTTAPLGREQSKFKGDEQKGVGVWSDMQSKYQLLCRYPQLFWKAWKQHALRAPVYRRVRVTRCSALTGLRNAARLQRAKGTEGQKSWSLRPLSGHADALPCSVAPTIESSGRREWSSQGRP